MIKSSKVPAAVAAFWLLKIASTAMGEACSDLLVRVMPAELAVGLTAVALAAALLSALRADRYVPWRYWTAVCLVAVFGTMAADVAHTALGVPYLMSVTVFAAALGAIFVLWRRREGTISIHSIVTTERELFYWATVMATFALGTAVGDLTATTFGWGYLASGIVFAVLFTLPAIAFKSGLLNVVAAFWTAYVITRPLGASFADWAAADPDKGGLGIGFLPVTAVLLLIIVAGVWWVTRSGSDRPHPQVLQSDADFVAIPTN